VKIKITLTRELAQVLDNSGINPLKYSPAYEGESVGLDLYNAGPDVILPNHRLWNALGDQTVMIGTGVHLALPSNTVALVKERGSITKTGLIARAGVIDPGYTGEIFVNLVNLGSQNATVKHGAKLPVQLVVLPCFTDFDVIGTKEYLEITQNSKRETGSLGSSDNKE
jgi:dUTPase